jgi:hypothetical protein
MTDPRTHAEPTRLTTDGLDYYASCGIALTRDAASTVLAALRRDAYDLRTRPVAANLTAADEQDALATAILAALAH